MKEKSQITNANIKTIDFDTYMDMSLNLRKIYSYIFENQDLVIVCIGTPRRQHDIIGPLVGTYLTSQNRCKPILREERYEGYYLKGYQLVDYGSRVFVYGIKQNPLTYKYATHAYKWLKTYHPGACVIAVDAASDDFGEKGQIGYRMGCASPGSGRNIKETNPLGNIIFYGVTGGQHKSYNKGQYLRNMAKFINNIGINVKNNFITSDKLINMSTVLTYLLQDLIDEYYKEPFNRKMKLIRHFNDRESASENRYKVQTIKSVKMMQDEIIKEKEDFYNKLRSVYG